MSKTLLNLDHPNTVSLLDKSVWDALKTDEIWTLSSVSTIALVPVLYEEIRAELTPRRKRKIDPVERLNRIAAKGTSHRTYALPPAWQLVQSELRGESIQVLYGIPVDMPYIFGHEDRGVILDQQDEFYDLQRWSSQYKPHSQDIEAAKAWRAHLAACRPSGNTVPSNTIEDADAIRKIHDDSRRQTSYAVSNAAGLANALTLLGFSNQKAGQLARLSLHDRNLVVERDAPYTCRSIALELFMRNIAKQWPQRGSNRADFMYFHYLPFCDIFATNDSIQSCYAQVWKTPTQQIVGTPRFRQELSEIENVRATVKGGASDFPPPNSNGIFASTLDRIRPGWRTHIEAVQSPRPMKAEDERRIVGKLTRRLEEAISRGTRVPARYGTKGESKPRE